MKGLIHFVSDTLKGVKNAVIYTVEILQYLSIAQDI